MASQLPTAVAPATSQKAPLAVDPPPMFRRRFDERLGLEYGARQTVACLGGAVIGTGMGLYYGAKTAGLRFRAENAHRLPTSHKGWYLYHKSKNYYGMWAGLKEGRRMGFKVVAWTGLFVLVEDTIDCWRNDTKDALSTVIAGLACGGGFSMWNRFPLATAARTARMSFIGSLALGLAQDAMGVIRGRDVSYVSFIKRRVFGTDVKAST